MVLIGWTSPYGVGRLHEWHTTTSVATITTTSARLSWSNAILCVRTFFVVRATEMFVHLVTVLPPLSSFFRDPWGRTLFLLRLLPIVRNSRGETSGSIGCARLCRVYTHVYWRVERHNKGWGNSPRGLNGRLSARSIWKPVGRSYCALPAGLAFFVLDYASLFAHWASPRIFLHSGWLQWLARVSYRPAWCFFTERTQRESARTN